MRAIFSEGPSTTGGLTSQAEVALAKTIEAGVLAGAVRRGLCRYPEATEAELIEMEAAGSAAYEEFVSANLGLVGAAVSSYSHRSDLSRAELFQEGCVALLQALQRFDYRRGFRFSTYAVPWITNAVSRSAATRLGQMSLSPSQAARLRRVRAVAENLQSKLERDPTADEVAEACPESRGWVQWALSYSDPESLDAKPVEPLPAAGDSCAGFDFEVGRGLTQRQREVVQLRFGFAGEVRTQREIGKELNISIWEVRAAEAHALKVIRERYRYLAA